MIFKKDWKEYLHNLKRKEIKLVFNGFPNQFFEKGLEVGCGDGYQTSIMYKYFKKFYATDLNFDRIAKENKIDIVNYLKCDAENLKECIKERDFDVIFSSSLLEHLPHPELFLRDAYVLLKDDGLFINIVPNRFWKAGQFFLHWFNLFLLFINKIIGKSKKMAVKIATVGNNLKSEKKYNRTRRMLWPIPHGNFDSNLMEFIEYGKKKWLKKFRDEKFDLIKYEKGPITSGYGFGLDFIKKFFEKIGLSSVHIFVLKKKF